MCIPVAAASPVRARVAVLNGPASESPESDVRPDRTSAYLAHLIAQWIQAEPRRSQAKMARLAGVSAALVSGVCTGSRGAGRRSLRAIAQVLGKSADAIEAEADTWSNGDTKGEAPTSAPVVQGVKFRNLAQAVELLLDRGKISRKTAKAAQELGAPIDLDETTWMCVLLDIERAFK